MFFARDVGLPGGGGAKGDGNGEAGEAEGNQVAHDDAEDEEREGDEDVELEAGGEHQGGGGCRGVNGLERGAAEEAVIDNGAAGDDPDVCG